MQADKHLLEMAARAAGINAQWEAEDDAEWAALHSGMWLCGERSPDNSKYWNPLTVDGDALRLAVKLNLDIRYESYDAGVAVIVGGGWDDAPEAVHEIFERDGPRAVRRAIVRAAAAIGEGMG